MGEYVNPAKIFGENVFNDTVMQERLPKNVYKKLKKIIEEGGELDLATADTIAHEMKEWAIEKGATHYTHWFQPLTGTTAEKHDSFITAQMPNGKVLMSFSGKELIKGEPRAVQNQNHLSEVFSDDAEHHQNQSGKDNDGADRRRPANHHGRIDELSDGNNDGCQKTAGCGNSAENGRYTKRNYRIVPVGKPQFDQFL